MPVRKGTTRARYSKGLGERVAQWEGLLRRTPVAGCEGGRTRVGEKGGVDTEGKERAGHLGPNRAQEPSACGAWWLSC